jgi:ABC-type uncharacterized transport system involved in gliding motility auxiliary subunit
VSALIRWSWVFGLAGGFSVLAAFALWYVLGDVAGSPRAFAFAGSIGLFLWLVLDRERLGDTVTSRAFTYGSTASLLTVMVATLATGLYVVARDHDTSWDWTGRGTFSLSEHSRQVCAGMNQDVRILAFYRSRSWPAQKFRDLSRAYGEVCPRLQFEVVDPVARPSLAREHEVQVETGVLILTREDGEIRRLEGRLDEERLTDALVVLLADTEHRICWTQGHGEPSPDDEHSERGLGLMVFEVDDLNYQIVPLITASEGVPRSCDAVIVASPESDWLPIEREALAAYLAEGGRVLVMLEPEWAPDLSADMGRYGVELRNDVVLDLNPQNQLLGVDEPTFVVLTDDNLRPHPITASLGASIVLGVARSVSVDVNANGVSAREILVTSEQAWGETDLRADGVGPDGDELQGEVPLMVVVEVIDPLALGVAAPSRAAVKAPADPPEDGSVAGPDAMPSLGEMPEVDLAGDVGRGVPVDFAPVPGGRLVVIGDSDFANNRFMQLGNNRDLFLNSLAWLVEEEAQLGQRPEAGDVLELTELQGAVLVLITVFGVPGLTIFAALLTLLRRRRL